MRSIEYYTFKSYAEVENGQVVQHKPDSVMKNPLDDHYYHIQLLENGEFVATIKELKHRNPAMKILLLLDEGILKVEDVQDYTKDEILETYKEKIGHTPQKKTLTGDEIQ
jgi:hypothetical protein